MWKSLTIITINIKGSYNSILNKVMVVYARKRQCIKDFSTKISSTTESLTIITMFITKVNYKTFRKTVKVYYS